MAEHRKRSLELLATASAALHELVAPGADRPAGFVARGEQLRFSLDRTERYDTRDIRLEATHVVSPERLADAMLEHRVETPREALEAAAADWSSDLSHDLDELHEEVASAVRTASAAATALGEPTALAALVDRLPPTLDYERRQGALEPFHQATRALVKRSASARLLTLSDQGKLPAPVRAVTEKKGRWALRIERKLDVELLKQPLTLTIDEVRPLSMDEVEELAWSGDDEAFAQAITALLAPDEAALRRELHRALRYADLLFGQELAVDRDTVARAIEQVAARHGDLDDYKLSLGQLAARARADKFQSDVDALEEHRSHYADVGGYYPVARSLKRRIELFVGPTNSGKTFRALNALTEGQTGVYLAPLRLLALEGQGEIERRGRPCSYLTGEEREIRPGAQFSSSTIEMLDFRRPVDAVLIDEIQLLSDPARGWAWTAALVGAPGRRVLLTGAPGCQEAVARIADMLGEELVITETQRLQPLEIEKRPAALARIGPGTAVIAFSRRDVLDLKATVEQATGLRCAVIYGNLSPRVRREEARRFREGEADVIISTDAIAMGLNLPIARVVFFTSVKYDGKRERLLTDHEILQIGGRAGRFGKAASGTVTALSREDLAAVQAGFDRGPSPIGPPFRVMPDERHVELLSQVLGTSSLERILTFFAQAITFDDEVFVPADLTDLTALAAIVDRKLPLVDARTRLTFASAPVEADNERMLTSWVRIMEAYASSDERRLDDLFDVDVFRQRRMTSDPFELLSAETQLKILTVYSWLAYRFPAVFRSLDACDAAKDELASFIEASLRGRTVRRCTSCGTALPLGFRFSKCNRCFRGATGPGEQEEGSADGPSVEAPRQGGGWSAPRLGGPARGNAGPSRGGPPARGGRPGGSSYGGSGPSRGGHGPSRGGGGGPSRGGGGKRRG